MSAHVPATRIRGISQVRLKRIIAAGNAAAFAIALWTIYLPDWFYIPGLLLCALLPLCGLALDLRTRGALSFESRRAQRAPLSLATILLMPALALVVRTFDLNFESYGLLIVAAVLMALAIFAMFWHFDPQFRGDRNQGIQIAMFALVYSYGALAFADVVFDPWSGQDTPTVVRDKRIHVSSGVKASSVWYQVKVDPEASPAAANWINVRPDLLDSFHRGELVCAHLGPGFLGVPWYGIRRCGR